MVRYLITHTTGSTKIPKFADLVVVTASDADIDLQLPKINSKLDGKMLRFKREDSILGPLVRIVPAEGDTIRGFSSMALGRASDLNSAGRYVADNKLKTWHIVQ